MSKDFAECKNEILAVLSSCFIYLCAEKLVRELRFQDTKNEDKLMQDIRDTVRLFAPELVSELNNLKRFALEAAERLNGYEHLKGEDNS